MNKKQREMDKRGGGRVEKCGHHRFFAVGCSRCEVICQARFSMSVRDYYVFGADGLKATTSG